MIESSQRDRKLREMLYELLEEPIFSQLSVSHRALVEGVGQLVFEGRNVSPRQQGFVCEIFKRATGRKP